MQLFDHNREELRAATRRRVANDPPPLPATARSGLRYRLVPAVSQAEMARTLLGCGATLLAIAIAAGLWILLALDPITIGWRVLLAGLALLALVASWSIFEGFRTKRRSHLPDYALELDDPDITAGRAVGITFVQERGARLNEVSVTLVCDETIVEETEVPCSPDVDAAHRRRRRHRVNGAGLHVDIVRTPTTSRIFERVLINEPRVDASLQRVTIDGEIALDPLVEPSGATPDHTIAWHFEVRGTREDGSLLGDQCEVRIRLPKDIRATPEDDLSK